jgi:hypothetical protein
MNSGELMVVLIVAIVMIAGIFKAKYGYGRHRGRSAMSPQENDENLRLREEVKELNERLKLHDRITVEKENSLSREIESLRDRP